MTGLAGQVALVTGGGRGFGRAIALALANAGAKVGVSARSRDQVAETVAAIEAAGGVALAIPMDVTDRAQVESGIREVEARFGPLSLLVNNAGVSGPYGPIAATDPDQWWHALTVHLYAPVVASHAALQGMLARRSGRIVNVASRAAIMFQPGLSPYVVGKSAQVKMTEHLDAEVKDGGVRVFAIQPGDAPTEFAHSMLRDPAVEQHLPGMRAVLSDWARDIDPEPVLAKCGDRIVEIALGQHDAIAGQYLDVDWDWGTIKPIEHQVPHQG